MSPTRRLGDSILAVVAGLQGLAGQHVLQLKGPAVSPTRRLDDSIPAVLTDLQGLTGQNVLQLKGPDVSPIRRQGLAGQNVLQLKGPAVSPTRGRLDDSIPGRPAGTGWPGCFATKGSSCKPY